MNPHTDQKYLTALIENNEPLVREIYQQNADDIRRFVVRNNGTIEDAKDVFQEALVDLLKIAAKGFILTRPLKGYLFGICRNKWMDKLNTKSKNKTKTGVTILDNYGKDLNIEKDLKQALKKEKQHELVIEKFNSLAPHCQEIIGLRWTLNETTRKLNSLKDIAAMLNRSYAYIRKEISLCMKKLMKTIQEDHRYTNL